MLKEAYIIIWDEAPMASKNQIESVNRLLNELMDTTKENKHFGGKNIIFSGDFRQVLPVLPKQGRASIVSNIIKKCSWWRHCIQLQLTINERLKRYGNMEQNLEFADFLMQIGNGTAPHDPTSIAKSTIKIPDAYIFNDPSINNFITWCYSNLSTVGAVFEFTGIILTPLNKDADMLNMLCLRSMNIMNTSTLLSADSVMCPDNEEQATHFPIEYLNSITLPGLPPHELRLKVGSPIILLRNINPKKGLCNGTRLIVLSITNYILTVKIPNRNNANNIEYLCRIDLITTENTLPFTMKRRQFPVKLAFAMTINKAQGQSFQKVAIYLNKPVFSHGQLYVALSRAGLADSTKIFMKQIDNVQGKFEGKDGNFTDNVVYKEVL
jgi:hypothetical protein